MLYLLNSALQGEKAWQQAGDILQAGDSVLLYEQAVKMFIDVDETSLLLAWLDQGIKIFVLIDPVNEELVISKALHGEVAVVDWEGFVELTVNEKKVCML